MSIYRPWLLSAAFLGFTATVLGAYGAHGLATTGISPERLSAFTTAVQYQFIHALALLALAFCGLRSGWFRVAGWAFIIGTLAFSGSIYSLVLLGSKGVGLITPLGGLCFMLGWTALFIAGCRLGGKNE